MLAYLLLADQPPSRKRLAQLLFDATEDPLGALRWSLAEVRRGLGPDASLEGDPVLLELPPGTAVDVDVVIRGSWPEALQLPGLGEGATQSGITSLRSAVGLADLSSDSGLQVRSRLMLAETLIHSLRGMDEEGLAALYETEVIAAAEGSSPLRAEISAELGYVDFLRERYDRAELRLDDALALAGSAAWVTAKAHAYRDRPRAIVASTAAP